MGAIALAWRVWEELAPMGRSCGAASHARPRRSAAPRRERRSGSGRIGSESSTCGAAVAVDDLSQLEQWAAPLLAKLEPAARLQLTRAAAINRP